MRKPYPGKSKRVQKGPITAASASVFVRAYVLKLFHRDDGEAADRPMIAEALLLVAFHFIDQQPHNPRVRKILRRMEGGVYARLSAVPSDPYKDVGPEPVAAMLSEFEGPQRHFSDDDCRDGASQ
jgi:hypothetical protein